MMGFDSSTEFIAVTIMAILMADLNRVISKLLSTRWQRVVSFICGAIILVGLVVLLTCIY